MATRSSRRAGGVTAANASNLFATELSGFERFDVSQYSVSLAQGLPPFLGARRGIASAEVGGLTIHGFQDGLLDASVTSRPDANGGRRVGLATRSAWGYRLHARLEFVDMIGAKRIAPSLTWIHDVQGNAPITLGTLLAGSRSLILALDIDFTESLGARVSYRNFLGRGNDADRYTDRDFVAFSLTMKFE